MSAWKTPLSGTLSDSFRIGKTGPTIYQGVGAPAFVATNGDLYVRYGSPQGIYQYVSGSWVLRVDGGVNFSYSNVISGTTIAIPPKQEMTCSNPLEIEGELDVEGALVING